MWNSFRSFMDNKLFELLSVQKNPSIVNAIIFKGGLIRCTILSSNEHFSSELCYPLVNYLVSCPKFTLSPIAPRSLLSTIPELVQTQQEASFQCRGLQMSQLFGLPFSARSVHQVPRRMITHFFTSCTAMDFIYIYTYLFILLFLDSFERKAG